MNDIKRPRSSPDKTDNKKQNIFESPQNTPLSLQLPVLIGNQKILERQVSVPMSNNSQENYEKNNSEIDWKFIFNLLGNDEYKKSIDKMKKEMESNDTYNVNFGGCTYIFQKKQKYDIEEFENIPTQNIIDMMDYDALK
jgi:hypothetical protein